MRKINITEQSIGPVFGFGSAHFHAPEGAPGFGSSELVHALADLASAYDEANRERAPDRVVPWVREATWNTVVRVAARNAFNAALTEKRAAQQRNAEIEQPAQPVSEVFARDVWATYRAADPAGRARGIASADLEELTALRQHGNRVPLEPELWAEATRRYRIENRLEGESVAASYPARATVEHPLVTGPDMEAARAEVERREGLHAERLAAVEANEATAQHLLALLAAIYEVRPDEILDAVLGRDDA